MSDATRVEEVVDIAAPRAVVFELLTTSEGLREWMAVEAECEAAPGGVVRWRHENGAVMRGRFVVVEPPSRLVFTYGWESGGPDVAPEATRVEITLVETAAGTRLELVHCLLPAGAVEEYGRGWRWFLARLAATSVGRSLGNDCALEKTNQRCR